MVPKVLVVEDDEGNCQALREPLEDEGYEVATAPNGLAAHTAWGLGAEPHRVAHSFE